LADLVDGLVNLGHEVTIVGAGRKGTKARLVTVWDRTIPERLGDPYAEVLHAVLTRRAVEDLAMAGEVDIVHDHTFSGPLNAYAYSELGLPTVVTVHGPPHHDARRYYRGLGTDVSLVAISHRQAAIAPELNWHSTVHNGLRPESWPFSRRKGDYALWLGRYHPDKAPHLALETAHAVGLPLILAGKCAEPVEKRYFAETVEPLLGPNDKVIGVADAILKRELLANARCLLFPVQWEEPFGMVMIESMVCGTPVVAMRNGAVPEVIIDGVTGLICDRPEQLPDALRAVTSIDPAACRRHVQVNFSAERMAAGYSRCYQRVLAKRAAWAPATNMAGSRVR
jgi:glycosyltransferase involved in cell wall biosynthesis